MLQSNSTNEVEIRKEYYESGDLERETPYVNGVKHGVLKAYYESGALWYEAPYVNGKEHGVEKYYAESGALWIVKLHMRADISKE